MTKRIKVWKSESLDSVNRTAADKIREALVLAAKGEHPATKKSEELYDFLADELERIEKLDSSRDKLELLSWWMNCCAYFDISEEDDELFGAEKDLVLEMVNHFVSTAKDFDDRQFLMDLMHDLAVNSVGEDERTELFLAVPDFLSKEETGAFVENVLVTLDRHELENEEEIFAGILDIADVSGDAKLYEKISLARDPDCANKTKIDIANAYYILDDVANAKRLLDLVDNPEGDDEEEFWDLKVGVLFKENKKKEALALAEALYEKYPKEYHLMSLCQVVSPERKEELLNAHEKFRLGESVNENYVNMLISLESFDRLAHYLDEHQDAIHRMDGEIREQLAERLDAEKHGELAKKLRKI